MDINELDKFKLSDAVKFHDMLNPSLWENNRLDNEVRNQLVLIAKEFVTYLGIKDLSVKDVTVSGSNAAYSYTPHSDLDLHILVDFNDLPDNEVYQELFTAKKTLFNDAHDITVHGVPVECYVQDVNEPVVSIGQYSVLHDRWIKAPKKSRANFDHTETKHKYEQLARLVELALKTHDLDRIIKVLDIIKRYRRAGLSKGGEFSPENLAYKAIRTQNGIQDLYDLRNDLESQKLSIEEAVGSKEDAIKQIKKISNVSGRTPNEIETIEKMIKNLMTSWDISPRDLGIYTKEPVRPTEPMDPLKAKIAKAAYEKQMAMDKLKSEWNKFKSGWFAEASGYIPSTKEKNDPRFKTALTVDVHPDAIKKNAKAFGFKTSRAGIPPQARADGKIK